MQNQALFIVLFNFDFGDKWHRMEAEEFEYGEVRFQAVQTAVQLPAILRYASSVVSFSLYPLQIKVVLLFHALYCPDMNAELNMTRRK